MTNIAVAYSSGHGHTAVIAEHIAIGAKDYPGARVALLEITFSQIGPDGRWSDEAFMAQLDASDAIIFGAPTYMGSAHGLFKLFLEAGFTPWLGQRWKDKVAAGFTNSASRSGDKLVALEQMAVFAAQMSMIWVGVGDPPGGNFTGTRNTDVNLHGSWLGLAAQSYGDGNEDEAPHPGDRHAAERFGRRIARVTDRWMAAADSFPPLTIDEQEARRRNMEGLAEWRRFDD